MRELGQSAGPPAGKSRALLQLIVGQLQIIAAIAGLVLLASLGVTSATIATISAAFVFYLLSWLMFHGGAPKARRWMVDKYFSEVLGTFALVFAGTGAIVINQISGGTITHVGIALTFGLVVLAMIYTFGDISGAHFNPAVTLGFWAAGRFEAGLVAPYILSQCLGAFLASGLLGWLFQKDGTMLGATLPAGSPGQSFVLEIVLTFLLMTVILSVSTGSKEKGITAGIAVGATIALEAMFAGPICGASMNPARSLAPAVVSGSLEHLWLYLLGPPMGALLATVICRCIRQEGCCGKIGLKVEPCS